MIVWDEDDESLALFLESEVLSEVSDEDEDPKEIDERPAKRLRGEEDVIVELGVKSEVTDAACGLKEEVLNQGTSGSNGELDMRRIEIGVLSKIPPELFRHILKFLSSEDLISCSLACKFMNHVASDESLWRRLYCMRWGLLPPTRKLRECPWKKLYIQRDEQEVILSIRNCQAEFREYYIQMNAAKRSQAPLPSQVIEDELISDKTVADQVSLWKSSKGLTDIAATDHSCSGETCTYYQVGDVFVCEKTGKVHVCDDTCREAILDPSSGHLVCTISGRCFDRQLSLAEDDSDSDTEQQQGFVMDEAEPFMGAGRFARAYSLGYNCADEKELEAALEFC